MKKLLRRAAGLGGLILAVSAVNAQDMDQADVPAVTSDVDTVARMKKEIETLTRENRELKAKLAVAGGLAPANPAPVGVTNLFDANEKLSQKHADAVLIIEGDHSVGTGFVAAVGGKKYLYTAAHVLSGNTKFTIRNSSGTKLTKFGQMETAEGADLARIQLLEDPPAFELATAGSAIQINTDIAALGNGGGAGVVSVEKGHILGTSGDSIEVDAEIIQGNSGGPVVDVADSKVVGVATHLTAGRKDIWASGTRQAEVRRFACRVNKEWPWKSTNITGFLAEGNAVADFDNITRLCYAMALLEPMTNGMRFDLNVGGNYTAAQILEANKSLPIVQSLYKMNSDLAGKKIGTSEADLKRQFRSLIGQALGMATKSQGTLNITKMAWFHRKNAEDSIKFRQTAIGLLNQRYEGLK